MAEGNNENKVLEIIAIAVIAFLLWKIFSRKKKVIFDSTPEPATTEKEFHDPQLAGQPPNCEKLIYRPLSPWGPIASDLLAKGFCYKGDGSFFDGKNVSYGDEYAYVQADIYNIQKTNEGIRATNRKVIQFRLINSGATKITTKLLNITGDSKVFDGTDDMVIPDAPTALAATDEDVTTFTAHWGASTGATGYYVDISTVSGFSSFVAGYQNLDVGDVTSLAVTGLSPFTTYYYRARAYNDNGTSGNSETITVTTDNYPLLDIDGNAYSTAIINNQEFIVENLKVTKYGDNTAIPNFGGYDDWFLPSKDELLAMYDELQLYGIGGFAGLGAGYWSSSEVDAWGATPVNFTNRGTATDNKTSANVYVRACRAFNSTTVYALRDIGPAGGWIFYKNGNDYLECAPCDQSSSSVWSNITGVLIGTTGTAIGTGQANTLAIIGQAGHTTSAAKLCDDLTDEILWENDITGAMCWYNNDIANKTVYGGMYNWHATDNAKGLVYFTRNGVQEAGWRMLTLAELVAYTEFGGGSLVAGGKLKETGITHWSTPNTGATDEYGFKALPGGFRIQTDGGFYQKGNIGLIWLSTELDASNAYYIVLSYNDATIIGDFGDKKLGLSVRCVRDLP